MSRFHPMRRAATTVMLALLRLAFAWALAAPAAASVSGVVISQVYGGGGNSGAPYANDFVELYNAGASSVSIAGWSVQYTSATGTSWGNQKVALTGSIGPGQYRLVQLGSGGANGSALPAPDFSGSFNISATTGKFALVSSNASLPATTCPTDATIVDLVGYGTASCFEGAVATAPSNTTAILRLASGCTDTGNNAADFAVGAPVPRNSASPAGTCGVVDQPIVPTCPASAKVATGAAASFALSATDLDGIVNDAAFQSGNAAGMSLTGFVPAAGAGGTAQVYLSLAGGTPDGSYPVVVRFANNQGQTATCTVSVTVGVAVGSYTPIHDIQGSGATSPLVNQGVTTRGVVTRVNNNGYFLQDPVPDADPLTSEGIFVFTGSTPTVTAGQLLQITGTVSEFNTGAAGNALTAAHTVTEITNVSATTVLGTGTITPVAITLPLANADDMERYEGMLVTITTPLTASQNYFQGRYGQVTLSAGGRLPKPTNLYRPGSPEALAQQALNARNSVMLDDGSSVQNPNPTPYLGADHTLRAGDTLPAGITGVVDYGLATSDNTGLAMYRIHPTVTPVFTRSNPRTAAPPAVGGNVKVASFNVLNYFTTFTDGTTASGQSGQGCSQGGTVSAANCRGADNLAEFLRQRSKIVAAMAAIGADVFGLMEIQNNGNIAVQNLVDALNASVGAGTYAVVPLPPSTGDDAIRVAMIYRPATLTLVGGSMSDAAAINNRPPFAQAFRAANGEVFSVIVNHLKSKSCTGASGADADLGDGQGCYNDRRKQQATQLLGFINTVKVAAGDDDVLVIGDLNAYGQEDPIDLLRGGGLIDQVLRYSGAGDYSYVFDGESGYIDHALATATMSGQVSGTAHWHINADEPSIIDYNLEFKQPGCATCGPDYFTATPYRASDHDPVVVGLNLLAPPAAQTITFAQPADQVALSAFSLSATASSGLAVSFNSMTPLVCSVTGSLATMLGAGVCTVAANQAGNAAYLPAAQVQRSFNVGFATQTITFAAPADRALGSPNFNADASASSGLTVSITSLTPTVCGASGQTVTLLATGTCTLRADQGGSAAYAAAPSVTRSFAITAAAAPTDGDVPLPPWALALLAGAMAAGLRLHRRGAAHSGA